MIPSPWVGIVLALAAYRLTRLSGWDDFPPIYKVRAWLIGESWTPIGESSGTLASHPGKKPSTEVPQLRVTYSRPLLAHLVHCPFCIGWWISLAVTVAWWLLPTVTLYALLPFAVSGAVGLIAKNLDP